MKTLYLVRHAKSSWKNPDLADMDRPLNKRGKRDAPRIGLFLKEKNILPDLIISSPANRALTTAKVIAEQIGYPVEKIIENNDLYTFSYNPEEITQILAPLSDQYQTVMLFGHNPTFTEAANFFGDKHFDNVPTCGVVGFQLSIHRWQSIGRDNLQSQLTFYMFPKMLPDN